MSIGVDRPLAFAVYRIGLGGVGNGGGVKIVSSEAVEETTVGAGIYCSRVWDLTVDRLTTLN